MEPTTIFILTPPPPLNFLKKNSSSILLYSIPFTFITGNFLSSRHIPRIYKFFSELNLMNFPTEQHGSSETYFTSSHSLHNVVVVPKKKTCRMNISSLKINEIYIRSRKLFSHVLNILFKLSFLSENIRQRRYRVTYIFYMLPRVRINY